MRRACAVAMLIMGCGPIAPYNTRLDPTRGSSPALPVPTTLEAYEAGVEVQWKETAKRCTQVEIAIAEEIDDRQRRLTSTKRWLLGIGSIAALTTTIYTGIEENPKKEVIVPLSAIGGAAVVTAIPALTEDDRVKALQAKLGKISTGEAAAIAKLNAIEQEIQKLTLIVSAMERDTVALEAADANMADIRAHLDSVSAMERDAVALEAADANMADIRAHLDSLTREYDRQEQRITPFEGELRMALAAWYDACR